MITGGSSKTISRHRGENHCPNYNILPLSNNKFWKKRRTSFNMHISEVLVRIISLLNYVKHWWSDIIRTVFFNRNWEPLKRKTRRGFTLSLPTIYVAERVWRTRRTDVASSPFFGIFNWPGKFGDLDRSYALQSSKSEQKPDYSTQKSVIWFFIRRKV